MLLELHIFNESLNPFFFRTNKFGKTIVLLLNLGQDTLKISLTISLIINIATKIYHYD